MNTKKATKRALLTSVMALVMCVVMLVGTTFAWFTDTASTGVNKIQAGNLDIELEMQVTENGETKWVKAEGETLQFKKAAGHEGEGVVVALLFQQCQQGAVEPAAHTLTDAVGRTVDGRFNIPCIGLPRVPQVGAGKAAQAAVSAFRQQKGRVLQHLLDVGAVVLDRGRCVLKGLHAVADIPVVQRTDGGGIIGRCHPQGNFVVVAPLCGQRLLFSLRQLFDRCFAL